MEWSLIEPPTLRRVPIWYPYFSRWPGHSLFHQFNREMDQMMGGFMHGYANINQGRDLQMTQDNKAFEVRVGVSNFQPEEIEVKVNDQDRMLLINAKHEENRDNRGFSSSQFSRQIYIPQNVQAETVESMITRDGDLVVRAKVKADGASNPQERTINIQREEP